MFKSVNKFVVFGIEFCELLGIASVVLKLCGVIDWSWWLVTVPFWCELVFAVHLVVNVIRLRKQAQHVIVIYK